MVLGFSLRGSGSPSGVVRGVVNKRKNNRCKNGDYNNNDHEFD
jgi:hypothetical protein